MKLNTQVFECIRTAGAKILVVTKYWDKAKTESLINKCDQSFGDVFMGVGENRIEVLLEKNLPREIVHYIGALQSKKLAKIAEYCSVVHSLDRLKHAEKLNNILSSGSSTVNGLQLGAFVQIKLDSNKPTGILPEDFGAFLDGMRDFQNIEILGISGMGVSISHKQLKISHKREEFELLKKIRDQYLPGKLISAGTSQDYKIALEEGMDMVRVGRGILV